MDLKILARLAIYGTSLREHTDEEKQTSDHLQKPTETVEETVEELLERLAREDNEN
jgi:hypothetical protein